jgi:hypothetical protein
LVPTDFGRARGGELAFDLGQNGGRVEATLGADFTKRFAAATAEIDAVSCEDLRREGMFGGDLSDRD